MVLGSYPGEQYSSAFLVTDRDGVNMTIISFKHSLSC